MSQIECSSKWSQMNYSNAPEKNEKYLWIVQNRTVNVVFERTSFIACTILNSGKGKAGNTFYQCEYEWQESIGAILGHVRASMNSLKIINNYLWKKSFLTTFIERCESLKAKFWTNCFTSRHKPR